MNRIQKAAAALIALAITLTGATLATAPLALAGVQARSSHPLASASCVAPITSITRTLAVRHG